MKNLLLALSIFSFLSLTACMHGGRGGMSEKCQDCKKHCSDCKDKKDCKDGKDGCDLKDEPKAEVKKEEKKK